MASPKNKRWSEIGIQRRTRSQRAPEDQTFRRMFVGHSAIMLLIDPQTDVILDANQAAVDFYGFPKSKLCGLCIQEINALPPEQVAVELQKAFNEQRNYFIFRHRLANGEERIVEVHSTPIALRKKQILFSIIHDITARKLADEALREAEWKFMALFELGPIGVAYHRMIYDDLGKPIDYYFIDANTKYIELTGVNPIGKTVIQAFPGIEHDPFDWIGTFGHVAQTGEPVRFEQYLQSNNRWYDCVGYKYKPGHFVAAFFEITARKQAETALRENEAMLKKVQAVAHMGSWEIDLTTKTVIASDEAHHVYGIAQGPMTLAYVQSVPLPEFRPILDAALTALITEGKRYDVEFKIQRLSDSEIRDIHSLAEYSASSRTIIGSVQDITERKRAEE
ncbi:MAG: PAS domain S-box protein, partial [Saprospiraceae bacterium]|nr:PAS domain S-box protein [Saprospiraceae bacterium]